ncbi:MAG: EAL domain-containing protein [Proteobacteria bacterium]|nr:EAL domain-containing protein [Pseudomonadota bacterium]
MFGRRLQLPGRTWDATMGDAPADLKYERDRFVAFAFATSDAFFELDTSRTIVYASGAVQWLASAPAESLAGRALSELVVSRDRPMLNAALETAKRQGRFGPVTLRFKREGKHVARVVANGTHLPTRGGRTYIAVSAQRMMPSAASNPAAVDEETWLLKKDAFADVAQQALKAGKESGQNYNMTLLDIEGIAELTDRLDKKSAENVIAEIAAHLQANSVNGQSAGQISADKYGLVHEAGLDIDALKSSIADRTRSADPGGNGLAVAAATIDLDAEAMSEGDNAKALLYTINKFSDTKGEFTVTELAGGYKEMLEETRVKIAQFKKMISSSSFDALFQPIVDLKSRKVHHYEALVRPHQSGVEASPFELITFAEEAGIINEFDLAMVNKVITKIKVGLHRGDSLSIAVNLSGRSIENAAFIKELHTVLKDCGDIRKELMFEVTESAKIGDLESTNNILQAIRRLGHHICLDDFGAGAAAYQYLRALEVDFVKIDGIYVRESLTAPNGKAFLKSMATLCSDLGIETVGEYVETEEVAEFLRQVGVNYGQGYLFGKPGVGISGTKRKAAAAE